MSAGTQEFNKMGPMFIFQMDPVNGVTQPCYDFGSIQERDLKTDLKPEEIWDERDGEALIVHEQVNAYDQQYEITVMNTANWVLAMYYRSINPAAYSQNSATYTNIAIPAYGGLPLKITDSNGNWMTGINAIVSIVDGTHNLVQGVDWQASAADLDRGIVYMLPTSPTFPAGTGPTTLTVSYNTYYASGYLMTPLTGQAYIEGQGEMHFASKQGAVKFVDRGRYSIIVNALGLNFQKLATVKPKIRKLAQATGANPLGQVIQFKGTNY